MRPRIPAAACLASWQAPPQTMHMRASPLHATCTLIHHRASACVPVGESVGSQQLGSLPAVCTAAATTSSQICSIYVVEAGLPAGRRLCFISFNAHPVHGCPPTMQGGSALAQRLGRVRVWHRLARHPWRGQPLPAARAAPGAARRARQRPGCAWAARAQSHLDCWSPR